MVSRSDRQWDMQLGVRHAFAPKWTVTPSISYLDNQSNVFYSCFEAGRTISTKVFRGKVSARFFCDVINASIAKRLCAPSSRLKPLAWA